jgi:cathepsin X
MLILEKGEPLSFVRYHLEFFRVIMKISTFSLALSVLVLRANGRKKCIRFSNQAIDDADDPSNSIPEVVKSPLPHTYIPLESLPERFDWRNVNGTNYATVDLNQHAPVYCGSCWLHGAISSLNDRLKIARNARFPEVLLARQVVLNCGNTTAGSCEGGGDYGLYVFAHRFGIPDDTCQLYSAQEYPCSAFRNCMNCDPPTQGAPLGVCYPVQRYSRYFASEYGRMVNPTVHEMKAEIWKRGPISCSIDASYITKGQYRPGDIVTVKKPTNLTAGWDLDHVISIAGWGVDETKGISYWIVRNSWGTFWLSDHGWFKVEMGKNVIGIETECNWAVMGSEPVLNDWGPSDTNREFTSYWVAPPPEHELQNAAFFGFVEDPTEVIPSALPQSETVTGTNKTRISVPENAAKILLY